MTPGTPGAVFLLTDYGLEDEFAGVTRAVVLRLAPDAPVVALTHGVPPFDVRAGALALSRSVVYLGPGVVVAVVDPGVGGDRRAVAVAVGRPPGPTGPPGPPGPTWPTGPRFLVGPDNGLLHWAIDALGGATGAVVLPRAARLQAGAPEGAGAADGAGAPGGPGGTFDGRDLFAPVAARLWLGASLHDVGIPVDPESLVRLPAAVVEVGAGSVETEVLWVDRFGNAQLAARADHWTEAGLGDAVEIRIGGVVRMGRRVGSFSALEGDEVGVLLDANGQLSLVCDRRAAATVLAVRAGDRVRLGSAPS